jgi:hypothetical protein
MEEIKMEKKYFGGNLDKNVGFGLAWLFAWISALIMFIMDKDTLDLEEKRELVSIFVCSVAAVVLSFTGIVPVAISIVCLVNAILGFVGKGTFKVPGAYHIAAAIIK